MRLWTYTKSLNETFLAAIIAVAIVFLVAGFVAYNKFTKSCEYGDIKYPVGFRTEGAGIANLCLPEPDRPIQDGICRDNDENTPVFECQSGEWVVLDNFNK